jgi:hypothetical protein
MITFLIHLSRNLMHCQGEESMLIYVRGKSFGKSYKEVPDETDN